MKKLFISCVCLLFSSSIIHAEQLGIGKLDEKKIEIDKKIEPQEYKTKLVRFSDPRKYDSCNSAALVQISFNATIASRNREPMYVPDGFEEARTIFGKDPVFGTKYPFAYLLENKTENVVVLSFIGTSTITQFLNNFLLIQVAPKRLHNYKEGMLVHKGFYRTYNSLSETLREELEQLMSIDNIQLVITGFSLGSGLATLSAMDFSDYNPIVYTFASPRVGNPSFTSAYNQITSLSNTWRVYNTADKVPTLPDSITSIGLGEYVYEHVGNPVPFTMNLEDQDLNHVQAYDYVLVDEKAPKNPNGICPNRDDCSRNVCPY